MQCERMWQHYLKCLFLFLFISGYVCKKQNLVDLATQMTGSSNVISVKSYVFWPNATVPFYVNPEHFDHEQSLAILSALAMFSFKTCLKFLPVMAAPSSNEHVLVFENSNGIRRCVFDTLGHSVYEPHRVTLGYECIESPQIDMVIMRALGFPFEHNRITRGIYIDVLNENIEQGRTELFTRDATLPVDLRMIPYDINSVMHFGTRDFSKNGHRTIMFKDRKVQQNRISLTKSDLRKIEVVYGPECQTRDRQEKMDLCRSYPGVARRKRDVNINHHSTSIGRIKRDLGIASRPESIIGIETDKSIDNFVRKKRDVEAPDVTKSLRVNPNITPPPNITSKVEDTLAELGINDAVQSIVEEVYKVSALALENARKKYCNNTKPILRVGGVKTKNESDILGIIELIADFAQGMVNNAVTNLTQFCVESESIDAYQRYRCDWTSGSDRCKETYKSTKSGAVKYSTQHRPVYEQRTKYPPRNDKHRYVPLLRSNDTDDIKTTDRRKRKTDVVVEDEIKAGNSKENYKAVDISVKSNRKADVDTVENDKKENDTVEHDKIDEKTIIVLRSATKVVGRNRNRRVNAPTRRGSQVNRARDTEEHKVDSSLSDTEKPDKHYREPKEPKYTHHSTHEETDKSNGSDQESVENRKLTSRNIFWAKEGKRIQEKERNDERVTKKNKREYTEKEDDTDEDEDEDRRTTKKMKRKDRNEREHSIERSEEVTKERKRQKPRNERSDSGPKVVKLSKPNIEFYKDRIWPAGIVLYVIQDDHTFDPNDLRRRLKEVNNILRKKTCVRLREITEDQATEYEDYIFIDKSADYVTGRVGGRQTFGSLELFRGDQHRQHTAMMVMAMLGFYFEVSRHDRDKYVRVHLRHVRADKIHHFEKIREDATLPLPYDFDSATQPAWQFWRHIGRSGISTVATFKTQDPDGSIMKSMGQNEKLLSDLDIVKINSVYGIKCFRKKEN